MLAIPVSIAHAEPVPAPKKIARQKSKVSKAKPKAEPASNPTSKLTPVPAPRPPYQVQADLPDAAQTRLSGSRDQCHTTGAVGAARNDECVWICSFTGAGVTV
ncbi:uncharacterized protein K441DRAFT_190940 [Cenococcum geophilum 1.58]|uniref:uncharacterized protein n=1 Tax=Cenococcum geophilum 1.58 TaxID=794803 RepID=UPI00358FD101|nr:hypothetical protein K441DRAFT_190940 [Cenococcum geophilum 1.58]